jgi:hypothetical protein
MYTLRKLGLRYRAYKLYSLWWMGTFMASVTVTHMKPEMKGGNLPASSMRRRRGSRGKRDGRARGRQPRRSPEKAAQLPAKATGLKQVTVKGSRDTYLARVRLRRMRWVEKRFQTLESLKKNDRVVEIIHTRSGTDLEKKASHDLQRFIKQSFRSKSFPLPPGVKDAKDLYRRWLQLKYGTWEDVDGELVVGEWSFPAPAHIGTVVLNRRNNMLSSSDNQFRHGVCRHCGFVGQIGPGFHLADGSCKRPRERNHPVRTRRATRGRR